MSFSTFGAPQDPPTRPLSTPPAEPQPEPGSRRRTLVLASALVAVAVAAGGYALVALGAPGGDDEVVDLVLPAPQPVPTATLTVDVPGASAPVATRNLFAALVSDEEPTAADPVTGSEDAAGTSGSDGSSTVPGRPLTPTPSRSVSPTPTAVPSPTPTDGELVDVTSVCTTAAEGAASVFGVLTQGTGTPKHLGHSLGTTVVSLRDLGARSEHEGIGRLVIGVGDAANGVREQLIAGTPPVGVDTSALRAAVDALGDPCDVAQDPLAG